MASQVGMEVEEYNSASDEDFNPVTDVHESDISSSEDDDATSTTTQTPKNKQKRRSRTPQLELDSGDEATIQQRRGKKRKARASQDDVLLLSDDESGEGGLIKTRAQRRLEEKERKPLARADGATADVDAIWARMTSAPVGRRPESQPAQHAQLESQRDGGAKDAPATNGTGLTVTDTAVAANPDDEYITIKRTYVFAGEDHDEERRVLRTSAEARLYLETQRGSNAASEPPQPESPAKPQVRRPLKRPSRFEPNPSGEVKGLAPELQLRWPRNDTRKNEKVNANGQAHNTMRPPPKPVKTTNLNTVEKSRYDWAGYVDKEGIAEELDEYGRSKQSYAGRMDFLNRMEARQEDERRMARMKQA